ncbi:hypothetical protein SCLCIDRAFT_1221169 [Scleroderma citrinum Foug A]|uniref:HMG box domain-containing protein n=1 Tax=Scleroderma citrinum Foug A TaxID=1036808 RepID=A0A0C3DGX2_9AGAM|nr:hypothetical protein SCLCIDRAFT_1221169 [Scleroderma citrinum Foug A]
MLSSHALRISLRSPSTRLVTPAALARRTFLTTALLQSPPAVKSVATKKKATITEKKKKQTPAKPAKKAEKPTKHAVDVSADDLPPKRPNSPYVIFFMKSTKDAFRKGLQKEGGVVVFAKRAGEAWAAMSTAEKQPYYDEFEVLKEQYLKAREQYFKNVDPKVLSAINKKRKERGLSRIRDPNREPQLPSPYLRFVSAFRSSPEGDAIMKDKSHPEHPVRRLGRTAGERWRSMSDDEKYPFVVAYNRDKEIAQANQKQAST